MKKKKISEIITRCGPLLDPDRTRVLIRPFIPTTERCSRIISKIMELPNNEVKILLNKVLDEFADRHQKIYEVLLRHFSYVEQHTTSDLNISDDRKLLIGAYFTQEYSLESAALFNPSIVPHPDQTGLPDGTVRIILSLRATGEGHISSITFRDGYIDSNNIIRIVEPTNYVTEPDIIPNPLYEKKLFKKKLLELDLDNEISHKVMNFLDKTFTLKDLEESIDNCFWEYSSKKKSHMNIILEDILMLAYSNYEVTFHSNQRLSERAIFTNSVC